MRVWCVWKVQDEKFIETLPAGLCSAKVFAVTVTTGVGWSHLLQHRDFRNVTSEKSW